MAVFLFSADFSEMRGSLEIASTEPGRTSK